MQCAYGLGRDVPAWLWLRLQLWELAYFSPVRLWGLWERVGRQSHRV
jgi:hypothetical protein